MKEHEVIVICERMVAMPAEAAVAKLLMKVQSVKVTIPKIMLNTPVSDSFSSNLQLIT